MTGCWAPDCTEQGTQVMPWSCPRCGKTGRATLCTIHDHRIRNGGMWPVCVHCADDGHLFQRLTLETL